MNYYDILLAKKLEDDRDPKVEGLSVTANGTYSEEGKVYKPVIVNVAGYGLADMPDGAIASFSDGAALPLNKLKVSIDPVQSGSGDPSPTNIRPISGWDECKVTVSDNVNNPTVSNVYTLDLDGTRYGGKVDLVSGVLTVDRASLDLGSRTYTKSADGYFYTTITDISIKDFNESLPTAICEIYKLCNYAQWTNRTVDSAIFGVNASHVIYIADSRFTDVNDLKTALNGVKLVYELATPQTIQLIPTVIKPLAGQNNIYADTGNIIEGQYFKTL